MASERRGVWEQGLLDASLCPSEIASQELLFGLAELTAVVGCVCYRMLFLQQQMKNG